MSRIHPEGRQDETTWRNTKSRGSNTKHQAPNSIEIPSSKSQSCPRRRCLGACDLELIWCLELGFWCFHPDGMPGPRSCVRRRFFLSCNDTDPVGKDRGRRRRTFGTARGPTTVAGAGALQGFSQGRIAPAEDL